MTSRMIASLRVAILVLSSFSPIKSFSKDPDADYRCTQFAAYDTIHMQLRLENISHAEATEVMANHPGLRKVADAAYKKCMAVGPNKIRIRHYCRVPASAVTLGPYKCKSYEPWEY